jgi:Pyruvate/2-oxoacid:ferredoxin oxidoreductase gamma subunit
VPDRFLKVNIAAFDKGYEYGREMLARKPLATGTLQ